MCKIPNPAVFDDSTIARPHRRSRFNGRRTFHPAPSTPRFGTVKTSLLVAITLLSSGLSANAQTIPPDPQPTCTVSQPAFKAFFEALLGSNKKTTTNSTGGTTTVTGP